ncbi:exodeoxyribonuclease V subunit beta [Candidatus Steffania adelgidicola]|uniref:exodeoxyribonuclease V subunit beta n=1 Tax=Candidatus Steffania adelgidicola TaxID=1076626 RepID=UPI001D0218D5|nr:exodeoxyribonuclease V subunit beta [Candidatus Steffania adelgidicola]UDG79904.1 RecBCD enzyme subunit RecB [Candidatus Steffania adelgidicola]
MTDNTFNPLIFPLEGTCLIEASAGTGKTYTLVMLYLRLLLGLGGEIQYRSPLTIEEILVVTFTDAATKELRSRIYETIHHIRLACLRGKREHPLLMQCRDLQMAALHLLDAERRMDGASIYTIHGFCQRMLNHNAIESGIILQQTLLPNEAYLRKQVSADFWRRHCNPLPLDVARMVQEYWEGPEHLLLELLPYLQGDIPIIRNPPDINESILACHARIITKIEDFKRQWRSAAGMLSEILGNHTLKRRIYSKKNLSSWFATINSWTEKPTINYQIPDELERFKISVLADKITAGVPPRHDLFMSVEALYQQKCSLRSLIFMKALIHIRQALVKEKQNRGELGFDDLLRCLDSTLRSTGGEALAKLLRVRYPMVMIDEFQDTDPQQYRIFHQIYGDQPKCGLLLIGDPKQAIYAFRGADIFTYIRARKEVNACYTLTTNWRSSPGMINAVNQLFKNSTMPFIFRDIPFLPATAALEHTNLQLILWRKPQSALHIWVQPGLGVSLREYQQYMARQCAMTIRDWLNAAHEGEAWLEGLRYCQMLRASDITVLVRNRDEATLIRLALAELMIPTVYLSNWNSVFEMPEAHELHWILQAVLMPEKDSGLRSALATRLLNVDSAAIYALNNDEQRWEERVQEFSSYRHYWQENGVGSMLRQMMIDYSIPENLLASQNGEHQLTNFLHLKELLQEASTQFETQHALLRWFENQLADPNQEEESQKLRLESIYDLVNIITLHKSKGQEFPVVFFPFAADFRVQKQAFFHDRETYTACLDLGASQESVQLAEEERLAEDIRLLYVALTRSIYHCSFGIASLYRNNRKKNGASDLHLSAVGYLIQHGKAGDADYLRECLVTLLARANGDITLNETGPRPLLKPFLPLASKRIPLNARKWPIFQNVPWRVTSYSGLQNNKNSLLLDCSALLEMKSPWQGNPKEEIVELTPHTFPRGPAAGIFLHSLFATLDFTQPINLSWLGEQLAKHGIDDIWLVMITQWIENIITSPLDGGFLTLADISRNSRHAELQFYLPISVSLEARDLDLLCKKYDPLSRLCPPLEFSRVKGMLKGFIDLVFRWQGRYYLLDYKSNWLGKESADYTKSAMDRAIIANCYMLQYQIYALAVHRFLRHRLVDYNYQRDFGGVYYLFLRGINLTQPGKGVFYCCPDTEFIEKFDTLLSGKHSR